ncbi:MAG: hypothetical protein WC799_20990 [Desulfobacteraceae bacterium]|jgi:hypothetical protein
MNHEDTNTNLLENPHGNIVNGDSQPLKPWNKPILFKKRGCEGKLTSTTEIDITTGPDFGPS